MKHFDVHGYRDEFITCRDEGHQWTHGRTYPTPGAVNTRLRLEVTRRRTCMNCEVTKDERFVLYPDTAKVTRLHPRYDYDPDYKVTGTGQTPWEVAEQCRLTNLLSNLEDVPND